MAIATPPAAGLDLSNLNTTQRAAVEFGIAAADNRALPVIGSMSP